MVSKYRRTWQWCYYGVIELLREKEELNYFKKRDFLRRHSNYRSYSNIIIWFPSMIGFQFNGIGRSISNEEADLGSSLYYVLLCLLREPKRVSIDRSRYNRISDFGGRAASLLKIEKICKRKCCRRNRTRLKK